ncbi:hypothetical protein V6N12_057937 [Hibiscus sabdariffa]|uniref:Uncharacterized protein n=1 Tax=Hibiscus sabdariffa TaxID=183260 RepID=A0ABR2AFA1_9ROSI
MLSPKHIVKKKSAFAEVGSEDGKRESAIPEPVATFLGRASGAAESAGDDQTSSTAEPLSVAQSSTLDETTQLNQYYTLINLILRQRQKQALASGSGKGKKGDPCLFYSLSVVWDGKRNARRVGALLLKVSFLAKLFYKVGGNGTFLSCLIPLLSWGKLSHPCGRSPTAICTSTKEEGQMVESQYGTNTNTNALIQLVAKVPIGIIPIAVQGERKGFQASVCQASKCLYEGEVVDFLENKFQPMQTTVMIPTSAFFPIIPSISRLGLTRDGRDRGEKAERRDIELQAERIQGLVSHSDKPSNGLIKGLPWDLDNYLGLSTPTGSRVAIRTGWTGGNATTGTNAGTRALAKNGWLSLGLAIELDWINITGLRPRNAWRYHWILLALEEELLCPLTLLGFYSL